MIVLKWCLPGSEAGYRTNKVGDQIVKSADALIAVLDQRKREILDALATPPTDSIDLKRMGTMVPRERPFCVVAYGPQQSWIATADHQLMRSVPNSNLEEIRCNNACGPIKRAQAAERARRAEWGRGHGQL